MIAMDGASAELARLDATEQARLCRDGEVAPSELVETAIERITALDPTIGAIVDERLERARGEAAGGLPDGPFRGVPLLLKDAALTSAGDRTQHGMRFLRDRPWRAPGDAELVRRLKAAGFVVLGRTKVPELSVSPTTEPLAHGPTRNPWALDHTPGGSSGGSAAAVAAGMVPVAHASDSGGSIRIPASCCGLVGLKPSRDRTTFAPDRAQGWGPLTAEHVLTRSVRDCAAILDVVAGPVPGDLHELPRPERSFAAAVDADPGPLRIGVISDLPGTGVHPICRRAVLDVGRLLTESGHRVDAFPADVLVDEDGGNAYLTVLAASVAHDVQQWGERLGEPVTDLEPMTSMLNDIGAATPAAAYVSAIDALAGWSRRIAAATAAVDIVVTPMLPLPPPRLGVLAPPEPDTTVLAAMAAYALPFNVSGQPAMSLPLGRDADGLPIGVQLVAPRGREDLVLALAAQLERARPWAPVTNPIDVSDSLTNRAATVDQK